jgi:hypothetical protein
MADSLFSSFFGSRLWAGYYDIFMRVNKLMNGIAAAAI